MMNQVRAALARLADAYRSGTSLALLFDYDGTLVPIATHPRQAVLGHAMRHRIEQLARLPSIFVGVLSGRAIDDLKHTVAVSGLYYAGTGGLEIDLRGLSIVHPDSEAAAQVVRSASERLWWALVDHPDAWVERKPLGLTVHYRSVHPSRIGTLRRRVASAIAPLASRLRVLDGPMAIEIVPDLGWTKRTAVDMIVDDINATSVVPLYAGDDTNDAEALATVAARGGVAIGIGARAPDTARYRLADPGPLGRCLDALLEMLAAGPTNGSDPPS